MVGFEATIIRKEPKALLLVQKSYKAFIPIMTLTIKVLKMTKTLHTDDTLTKTEMHQCFSHYYIILLLNRNIYVKYKISFIPLGIHTVYNSLSAFYNGPRPIVHLALISIEHAVARSTPVNEMLEKWA